MREKGGGRENETGSMPGRRTVDVHSDARPPTESPTQSPLPADIHELAGEGPRTRTSVCTRVGPGVEQGPSSFSTPPSPESDAATQRGRRGRAWLLWFGFAVGRHATRGEVPARIGILQARREATPLTSGRPWRMSIVQQRTAVRKPKPDHPTVVGGVRQLNLEGATLSFVLFVLLAGLGSSFGMFLDRQQ